MAGAAWKHDSADATTGEEKVCDLYKIPLELELGGGQKWGAITYAVIQVASVELNDKREENNSGDQKVNEPCEDADNGGKEVGHDERRA